MNTKLKKQTPYYLFKKYSFVLALAAATVPAQGKTLTTEFDFGDEYPVMLIENESVTANIDFGYSFDSIESSCIKAVHKSGEPTSLEFSRIGFLPNSSLPLTIAAIHPFSRSIELVDPNDPDSGFQLAPFDGDFIDCSIRIPAQDLANGKTSIGFKSVGGNYEAWSFELVVTGTVALISLGLELDEDSGFSVPAEGGRVNYDASIRNLDSSSSAKELKQWSVLVLPNGELYPIHKANSIEINYSESKEYTRSYLNIPSWFSAGSYKLAWYVADPLTGIITTDNITFTKSE